MYKLWTPLPEKFKNTPSNLFTMTFSNNIILHFQSLARNIPGIAIHISLTQTIHTYLTRNGETSMVKSGLAGCSARCITVSVLMPFTVLKTRIEVNM